MGEKASIPRRNGFAYLLALFVPYAGRLGAGFGMLMVVYIVGVLAAVALPAYQDYTVRAKVNAAVIDSQGARNSLSNYYLSNHKPPESLDAAGIDSQLADGTQLSLDPKQMELTVRLKQGQIIFTPALDDKGRIVWSCRNGEGLKPTQLPPSCRNAGPQ